MGTAAWSLSLSSTVNAGGRGGALSGPRSRRARHCPPTSTSRPLILADDDLAPVSMTTAEAKATPDRPDDIVFCSDLSEPPF